MTAPENNSKTPDLPSPTGELTKKQLEERHQRALTQMRSSPGWAANRKQVRERVNLIRAASGLPPETPPPIGRGAED